MATSDRRPAAVRAVADVEAGEQHRRLRRDRDAGALEHHQQEDPGQAEVADDPSRTSTSLSVTEASDEERSRARERRGYRGPRSAPWPSRSSTRTTPLRARCAPSSARRSDGCSTRGAFILGPEVEAFEARVRGVRRRARTRSASPTAPRRITIALRALGVGPGDEVVVPSFTFYASAEAIPPTGARPVFCDVDPDDVLRHARDGARGADAAHEGGRSPSTCSATSRPSREIEALGVPVVEDAAQAAGSPGRTGAPGRARHGRDVLASTRPRTSAPSATAARSRPPTTRSPSACARCASTARATRSPTSRSATTRASTSSRPRSCASSCPHLDELGRRTARRPARWYAEAGLGDLVALPAPTPGATPAWHLYVPRHERADELAGGAAGRRHRRPRRTTARRSTASPRWRPTRGRRADLPGTDEAARTHLALPITRRAHARAGRRGRRRRARCASGST